MSVREKLKAELSSTSLDPEAGLDFILSILSTSDSNASKVKSAKDFLVESGLSQSQVARLVPLLSRLVIELAETTKEAQSTPADGPSTSAYARKPKERKEKKLNREDLQEMFDLRAPILVQRYSDDEGPVPIIRKVNKQAVISVPMSMRSVPTIKPVPKTPPVTIWATEESPVASHVVPPAVATPPPGIEIDYGGFW